MKRDCQVCHQMPAPNLQISTDECNIARIEMHVIKIIFLMRLYFMFSNWCMPFNFYLIYFLVWFERIWFVFSWQPWMSWFHLIVKFQCCQGSNSRTTNLGIKDWYQKCLAKAYSFLKHKSNQTFDSIVVVLWKILQKLKHTLNIKLLRRQQKQQCISKIGNSFHRIFVTR